jgi:hypothetical protein
MVPRGLDAYSAWPSSQSLWRYGSDLWGDMKWVQIWNNAHKHWLTIRVIKGKTQLFGHYIVRTFTQKSLRTYNYKYRTGGLLFGCGLSLSAVGVSIHSLPLLYLGNVLCGVGYGCAYTPPLQVSSFGVLSISTFFDPKCLGKFGIFSYCKWKIFFIRQKYLQMSSKVRYLNDKLAQKNVPVA